MAGQVPRGSRGHGRTVSPRLVLGSPRGPLRGRTWPWLQPLPSLGADASIRGRTWRRDRPIRKLTGLGLTPDEAGDLTAYMCGIPIDGAHWSLRQVNQLLFLRELQRTGRFGSRDGRTPRPN